VCTDFLSHILPRVSDLPRVDMPNSFKPRST